MWAISQADLSLPALLAFPFEMCHYSSGTLPVYLLCTLTASQKLKKAELILRGLLLFITSKHITESM